MGTSHVAFTLDWYNMTFFCRSIVVTIGEGEYVCRFSNSLKCQIAAVAAAADDDDDRTDHH